MSGPGQGRPGPGRPVTLWGGRARCPGVAGLQGAVPWLLCHPPGTRWVHSRGCSCRPCGWGCSAYVDAAGAGGVRGPKATPGRPGQAPRTDRQTHRLLRQNSRPSSAERGPLAGGQPWSDLQAERHSLHLTQTPPPGHPAGPGHPGHLPASRATRRSCVCLRRPPFNPHPRTPLPPILETGGRRETSAGCPPLAPTGAVTGNLGRRLTGSPGPSVPRPRSPLGEAHTLLSSPGEDSGVPAARPQRAGAG